MAYRIEGLPPQEFEGLFEMPADRLETRVARRVTAHAPHAFPCRITLEDAEVGDELLLINHVSHDVAGPFRTAFAIFVREGASRAACYIDETPLYLERRTLGLRGFDCEGMLAGAVLALPGEADARMRSLFERPEISVIHAHNAAHGCFLARIERN